MKTIYHKHKVLKFFSRKKDISYKVLQWSEDGMKQFSIESGKFDGDIERLRSQILRSVGGK